MRALATILDCDGGTYHGGELRDVRAFDHGCGAPAVIAFLSGEDFNTIAICGLVVWSAVATVYVLGLERHIARRVARMRREELARRRSGSPMREECGARLDGVSHAPLVCERDAGHEPPHRDPSGARWYTAAGPAI